MKLHVPNGPLPIAPPYLDVDSTRSEREEEIDLGELFDRPVAPVTPVTDDVVDLDLQDLLRQPTLRIYRS